MTTDAVSGYADRFDAGRELAQRLVHLADREPLILAIPRGGVEVGRAVADELGAPLDIVLVRKLPIPFAPETAFGVMAEDGTAILDEVLVAELGLDSATIEQAKREVQDVLERYARELRAIRPRLEIRGATVILVDDGLATGYTMLGAARVTRKRGAAHVIVAAPVSSDTAADLLKPEVDEFVCSIVDPGFVGVSAYYRDFEQLDDADVQRLLSGG